MRENSAIVERINVDNGDLDTFLNTICTAVHF